MHPAVITGLVLIGIGLVITAGLACGLVVALLNRLYNLHTRVEIIEQHLAAEDEVLTVLEHLTENTARPIEHPSRRHIDTSRHLRLIPEQTADSDLEPECPPTPDADPDTAANNAPTPSGDLDSGPAQVSRTPTSNRRKVLAASAIVLMGFATGTVITSDQGVGPIPSVPFAYGRAPSIPDDSGRDRSEHVLPRLLLRGIPHQPRHQLRQGGPRMPAQHEDGRG